MNKDIKKSIDDLKKDLFHYLYNKNLYNDYDILKLVDKHLGVYEK